MLKIRTTKNLTSPMHFTTPNQRTPPQNTPVSPTISHLITMELQIQTRKLVKPDYQNHPPPPKTSIPLSVFDTVTYDSHVAAIYAYKPPTPPNHVIENGLRKALVEYREYAGRLTIDESGRPAIILNDEGVLFVEATCGNAIDNAMPLTPSPELLNLHPGLEDAEALRQVQLTRFACGGLMIGVTAHHVVADAHANTMFTVAWGRAARGLQLDPRPLHDRSIFVPRNPLTSKYQHFGVEFSAKDNPKTQCCRSSDGVEVYKAHFTSEFLSELKAKASVSCKGKKYSTFESLLGHLWRHVTFARGLDGSTPTQIRIAVDGRSRFNPLVVSNYFGNLVLWAFPCAKVGELLGEPLGFAAGLIRDAIAMINGDYFHSFVDFVELNGKEGLEPSAEMENWVLCPNLEVNSWLRFPFYDVDFGSGSPNNFSPSWFPCEGCLSMIPSPNGDGSVEALVPLLGENMALFKEICYSLDYGEGHLLSKL